MNARLTASVAAVVASLCAAPAPAQVDPGASARATRTPWYEAFLYDTAGPNPGLLGAATGPEHPITRTHLPFASWPAPAHVLSVSGGASLPYVRSWTSGRDYMLGTLRPSPPSHGFDCVAAWELDPPSFEPIERDGRDVGSRATWVIDRPPDALRATLEVRVVGDSFVSSSVAITLAVENLAAEEARVGLRLLLNPDLGLLIPPSAGDQPSTTAPNLAFRPPDPPPEPFRVLEGEWTRPEARAWEHHGRLAPSRDRWLYFIGGSLVGTSTLDPPATVPDRFHFSAYGNRSSPLNLDGTCFAFSVPSPPRQVGGDYGGGSNALAYAWGPTEAEALRLPPGASTSATVHVFAYLEHPVTCDVAGPPRVECQGPVTPVHFDGSGSEATDGTPLAHAWRADEPAVAFDPPDAAVTTAWLPSPGRHVASLLVEAGPYGAECGAEVEVVDTTPPRLTVPPLIERRTSEDPREDCLTHVTLLATADDACAGNRVELRNDLTSGGADASGDYAVGDTVVAFTATDPSGNSATAQAIVRVIDDVPPSFTLLEAYPRVLWPPNHRLVDVSVAAAVRDDCDPAPRIRLKEVRSDEAADDLGDGRFEPDVVDASLGEADFEFRLRAERSGLGTGRTYTLVYEAEDAHGNRALAEVEVIVPHDWRPGRRP